ncbi:MAG: FHA domain-containing protein [Anaerolineae bacterium]|nr:FHA domain-containing protein [Anaerolineae bacterium]
MVVCPNCGSQQADDVAFCDECGAALSVPPPYGGADPAYGGADPAYGGAAMPVQDPYTPTMPVMGTGASVGGSGVCPICGAQLEQDSAFCDMCGAPVGGGAAGYTPTEEVPTAWQTPSQSDFSGGGVQQPNYGSGGVQYGTPQFGGMQQPDYGSGGVQYGTPPPYSGAGYEPHPVAYVPSVQLLVAATHIPLSWPQGKTEVVLGRQDPIEHVYPDVDLTNFGGEDAGVSRRHACIRFQGQQAYVEDLGSRNHTFVNGQQLYPGQSSLLQSGDRLRLSQLELVFYIS